MTYTEFEKQVVDTFNRMHYIESCDDVFCIEGSECDVQTILSRTFCSELNIKYDRNAGYVVSREGLMNLFLDDLDEFYPEMFQSFNDIMNRYNVMGRALNEFRLHII